MNIGRKLQFDFVVLPFILASEGEIDGKHSDSIMSPKFQPRNNI